VKYIQI